MANKFGEGSQADYDKFMIFKKSEAFKGVPAGQTWVWYINPSPRPKIEIGENGMEVENEFDEFFTAKVTTETHDEYILDTDKGELKISKKNCFMRNPMRFDGVDDMSQLTQLSEATVLYNLKMRYMEDIIHTYSGLFCVVINPYRFFPIYTPFMVHKYQGRRKEDVAPHVYSIADGAYRAMLEPSSKIRNQSILITGESGAGKTENTKRVIQYLAMTAGQSKKADQLGELEEQLIQLNPMLEAFGNAKTVKNNNSSRFGKFIEIQFSNGGKIVGCIMSSYLLEKSRIVFQAKEDRNYHIFYQLLAGATSQQKTEMHLESPEKYKLIYQNKKSSNELIVDGIDDNIEFKETIKSMRTMNISDDELNSIWKIIAGMLHLGNVQYSQGKDGAELINESTLAKAAEMFGVDGSALRKAIIQPKIKVGNEDIYRHLSKEEAEFNTNATLKAIYHRLFVFIVNKVNETMGKIGAHSIGILDIAGFEIFRENSFEQLCINLTNEKLQQFFNNHMFNLEQIEYMNEGIPWNQQNFGEDLQPVIDLIESKIPVGVLAMLDEQSYMSSGTDENFHGNVCNSFGRGHPKFRKPRIGGALEFDIRHYAGDVTYNAKEWVKKNRDPLERDIRAVFVGDSKNPPNTLISKLFNITEGIAGSTSDELVGKDKKAAKFLTVGGNHKTQLEELMRKLRLTNPHFIRCILPNTQKKQRYFIDSTVLKQLRCNGVLEGIRITRMGYPNRMFYSEFLKRYYFLGDKINRRPSDEKATASTLMKQFISKYPKDGVPRAKEGDYQFGKTKIFFKVGILAEIEEVRESKISQMIGGLQAVARAFAARKHFSVLREQQVAVTVIQKTLKSWVMFRNWAWWKLYVKARPMLKRRNFEEEVKKKDKEIEDLKKKLEEEIKRREKAENALASATSKIAELEAKIMDLEDKISDLEDKLSKEELDKAELQLKIDNLYEDIKDLKEEIDKKKSELKDSKLKNEDLEDEIMELNTNINNLNVLMEKKEKIILELQDQLEDKSSQIHKLKEEIKLLNEEKDDLEQDRTDISSTKDEIAKKLTKINIELEDTKDDLAKTEQELDDLIEKNKQLTNELQTTQLKLGETEKLYSNQLNTTKKVIEERDNLNQKLENEKLITKNLTKTKGDLEKKASSLKQDIEDLQDEKNSLENNLRNAQRKIKELDDEITKGSDVSQYLQQQKIEYETQINQIQNEKEGINNSLKNAEKLIKEKDLEMNSLKEKLIEIEKEKEEVEKKKKEFEKEIKIILDEKDNIESNKNLSDKEKKKLENDLKELQKKNNDLLEELEKIKKLNKEINQKLNELNENNDKISTDSENLNKKKIQYEKELSNLKVEIEAIKKINQTLEQKRKDADNEKIIMNEELEQTQEKLKSIQTELRKSNADLNELIEKKNELETLKDKLVSENKKINKELEEIKSREEDNNYKIENNEKILKRMETDLSEAIESLEIEKKDRMNKEKNVKKLEIEIKELKEKISNSNVERDSIFNAKKQVEIELQELMKTVDQNDEVVAGFKTQITKLNNDNKSLEEEIITLKDKSNKDKKKINDLQQQIIELEERPVGTGNADENEIKIRDVQINDLKKALDIKADQNNQFNSINKELKTKNAELTSKIEIIENELKKLENTKKRLENEKEESDKLLTEQVIKRKGFEEEIKKLNTEIQSLKFQINAPTSVAHEEEKIRLENTISELKEQLEQERNIAANSESIRKKIQEELDEVKFNLDDITNQRTKLNSKVNELQTDLDSLKEEKVILQNEIEKITDDNNKLNIEIDSLDKKYNDLLDSKDSDISMKEKFQDELKNTKEYLDQEKKLHAETLRIKGRLEKEIAEIQVRLDSERKNNDLLLQEKSKIQKDFRSADAELKSLSSELEDTKDQLDKIQDSLDDKENELATLDQKYKILVQKNATFDSRLQELQEQLDLEKTQRAKAVKQKNAYEKKLKELQDNDNDFEEYKESADKRINKLSAQKDDLQKELEKERSMKQESDKEVQRLREKVQELETKNAEAGGASVSMAKVKAKYEAEIDDLTKEAEEAIKAKSKSEKKLKTLTKKIEELEKTVTDYETKEVTFNTQTGKIQAEIKKYQQQIRDNETRLNELEDMIKKEKENTGNKQLELDKVNKQYEKLKKQYKKIAAAQDDSDD